MNCTVTPAAVNWQVAAWLRVGGRPCMKLKEGARWILCIFFRAITAGQVKQGTGALLQLEEKKREMESILKPPQAVRRGGEGERWEECRNNSSYTPEI